MIPCQRHLFDLPDDAAYFRCASTSPLLKRAGAEGQAGVARKLRPWTIGPAHTTEAFERLRGAFASLIGAASDDVALAPSVSFGTTTAAAVLPLTRGQEVVLVADEFPALVYPLRAKARAVGAAVRTVPRPPGDDWTAAVLAAIGPSTGIVGLCQVNWLDGATADLAAIAAACRHVGAALVLDLSQSLGAMPLDLRAVDPDFIVATAEKWLFGPCRLTYMYVAPRWHGATPLEIGWGSRVHGTDPARLTDYTDDHAPGARRFDADEHLDYVALPQAIAGLEQILAWGVADIAATLKPMVDAITTRAAAFGYAVPPAAVRAPHLLGLRLKSGPAPVSLAAELERRSVYVAVRNGVVRIAPHVYNTPRDVDALLAALGDTSARAPAILLAG